MKLCLQNIRPIFLSRTFKQTKAGPRSLGTPFLVILKVNTGQVFSIVSSICAHVSHRDKVLWNRSYTWIWLTQFVYCMRVWHAFSWPSDSVNHWVT